MKNVTAKLPQRILIVLVSLIAAGCGGLDPASAQSTQEEVDATSVPAAVSTPQTSCIGVICPAFGGHNFCPTTCGNPEAMCFPPLANTDNHWRCNIPQ